MPDIIVACRTKQSGNRNSLYLYAIDIIPVIVFALVPVALVCLYYSPLGLFTGYKYSVWFLSFVGAMYIIGFVSFAGQRISIFAVWERHHKTSSHTYAAEFSTSGILAQRLPETAKEHEMTKTLYTEVSFRCIHVGIVRIPMSLRGHPLALIVVGRPRLEVKRMIS